MTQLRIPFLATLNLHDLSKLTNDSISHDPTWMVVSAKIPLEIPKFEGKSGEEPREHVNDFHLWCSSNSFNHDSIHIQLFQRNLTGPAMKWYIEFPGGTY